MTQQPALTFGPPRFFVSVCADLRRFYQGPHFFLEFETLEEAEMARKVGDIQLLKPAVATAIHDTLREGMEPDELISRLAAIVASQWTVVQAERRREQVAKRMRGE